MEFCYDMTLFQKAALTVLASFWNQEETQKFMEPILFNKDKEFCSAWKAIEKRIELERVEKLPLPPVMKDKLKCLIRPIGLRELRWREYRKCVAALDVIPCRLSWVPCGYLKKAEIEELIRDEQIEIADCFELACIYCFSCCEGTLWQQAFDNSENNSLSSKDLVQEKIILSFWSKHLNSDVPNLYSQSGGKDSKIAINTIQCAFECATLCGNKVATAHFLKQMSAEERNQILCGIAQHMLEICNIRLTMCVVNRRDSRLFFPEFSNDMFCFLLSKMNREEQAKVMTHYPALKCLLHWPWQAHFIDALSYVWDGLCPKEYVFTVRAIVTRIRLGFKDYNYPHVFECFWKLSPAHYRNQILEHDPNLIFLDLFHNRETRRVSLILKDATESEKKELASCFIGKKICCILAEHNLWDLLEFFLRQCFSSESDMLTFREEFVLYSTKFAPTPWKLTQEILDQFIELFDRIMQSIVDK